MKEFSRPLFSGPRPDYDIKKKTTFVGGFLFSSGKRDSDPRPRPWQGRALPTELFPRGDPYIEINFHVVKGKVENNEFFGTGVGKRGKGKKGKRD